MLSYRVFPWPSCASSRLADHGNGKQFLGLLRGEGPPADDGSAYSREITRRDIVDKCLVRQTHRRSVASLYLQQERHGAQVRQAIGKRDMGNLGKRLQANQYFPLCACCCDLYTPNVSDQT